MGNSFADRGEQHLDCQRRKPDCRCLFWAMQETPATPAQRVIAVAISCFGASPRRGCRWPPAAWCCKWYAPISGYEARRVVKLVALSVAVPARLSRCAMVLVLGSSRCVRKSPARSSASRERSASAGLNRSILQRDSRTRRYYRRRSPHRIRHHSSLSIGRSAWKVNWLEKDYPKSTFRLINLLSENTYFSFLNASGVSDKPLKWLV